MVDQEMPITQGPLVGLDALAERRVAVTVQPPPGTWSADQIKEFIGAILREKERADEVAAVEREKSAAALRGEQQRANDQARLELARAIHEGDERLREHISTQVTQIQAALESADKLEVERMAKIEARITGLDQHLSTVQANAASAQEKFEAGVTARFTSVNEFRAALSDLSKQMATRRELEDRTEAYVGWREEIGKQLGDIRSRLDTGPAGLAALQTRADTGEGAELGAAKFRTTLFAGLGAVATIIAVVVAANTYTGHNNPAPVETVTVTTTTTAAP